MWDQLVSHVLSGALVNFHALCFLGDRERKNTNSFHFCEGRKGNPLSSFCSRKNQPLSSWKKIVVVVYLHIACFHYVVGIDRDGSRITDIFRASRKINNTDHAAQIE